MASHRPPPRLHRNLPRPDVLYGRGYDPTRPCVLSVAHDEAAGDRLFVITDRPCVLVAPETAVPLIVPDGSPLAVLASDLVAPVKLRLTLSGAVPHGAAWQWTGGPSSLRDLATAKFPNPAAGTCVDTPGPYVPPPSANIVATWCDGGFECTLTFDLPVALTGDVPDDAMTMDGAPPISVAQDDPYTLRFVTPVGVSPGEAWAVVRQPTWIVTALTNPASGTF